MNQASTGGLWRRRGAAVRGRGFLIAASLIALVAIAGAALPWIGLLEATSCW